MSEVSVTVQGGNPDDIVRTIRRYMRLNHPEYLTRARTSRTARKARERRQWHKVAGR